MSQLEKKVVVLAGGHSAEREVSLRSGLAVQQALENQGIKTLWFDPAEQDLLRLQAEDIRCAFIALHGRGGEDGETQAVLNQLGIPYTGSKVMACALAMDKWRTKLVWQGLGLPTAPACKVSIQTHQSQDYAKLLQELGGHVMVKPLCEGSSIGMAIARTEAELIEAVEQAFKYDPEVLVETWLSGAEYTVAVIGQTALPVIRVEAAADFYDYEAKYQTNQTQYFCPAGLSDEQEQAFRILAEKAFAAVGAVGWGRVDLMLDAAGQPQLLEINLVPGMTEKSLVPMAAKQHGLSFEALVLAILAEAETAQNEACSSKAKLWRKQSV